MGVCGSSCTCKGRKCCAKTADKCDICKTCPLLFTRSGRHGLYHGIPVYTNQDLTRRWAESIGEATPKFPEDVRDLWENRGVKSWNVYQILTASCLRHHGFCRGHKESNCEKKRAYHIIWYR